MKVYRNFKKKTLVTLKVGHYTTSDAEPRDPEE